MQFYLRRYPLLSGMTGTAKSSEDEFWQLYDLKDYKGLVNEPVTFPSKRGYKYTGFYYHAESYDSFRGLIVFSHGIFDGHLSYLPEICLLYTSRCV